MNYQKEILNNISNQKDDTDFLSDIDFGKILQILRKSLIWVLFIIILCFTLAYLYIRYTKPVYESQASLKLTVKNEKSLQGLEGIIGPRQNEDIKNLAGELEFIRSEIIYREIINSLGLQVSYNAQGNILDNELYDNPPFKVEGTIKSVNFFDLRFYVRFISDTQFSLTYEQNDEEITKTYNFGQKITTPNFEFVVKPQQQFLKENKNNTFFFVFNSHREIVNYLNSNLKVGIANADAKIIRIAFTDYNLNKAQDIIATIDTIYKIKSVEEKNKSNRQQIDFLNNQLGQYEDSLLKYESQIQSFYLENKTKNIDDKLEKSIEEIEKYLTAKQSLAKKLALFRQIEGVLHENGDLKDVIPRLSMIENEQVTTFVNKVLTISEEKEKLKLSEKEPTFKNQKINLELSSVKSSLLDILSANRKLLTEQLIEINTKLIDVENSLYGLPSKGREFNRINRLYTQYETYYTNLLNKRTEIRIAEAGVVPDIITLSPASLPVVPIAPIKFQIYAVSAVIGILLSLGLILLRYLLHNTITGQSELEKLLPVPLLGVLPEYNNEKMKVSRIVVKQNPKSSINEALRSIRTNLEFMLPSGRGLYDQNSSTVFSVTSTISGEGKTFVATNLGGIIALSDVKVVILDFDMRKPKLHLAFGATNDQGVSSILIGKKTVEECIQKTEINSLDFISSGPTPPNPSELIMREDFDLMLKKLKTLYNIVIIDTPPVGLVTDGILIMKKVDLPIYIFRANYSKKFFGKNIKRLVNANNFTHLAVILNSVKRTSGMYGGYGGYGAYGGYGGYYGGGYYEDPPDTLWRKIKKVLSFKKKK